MRQEYMRPDVQWCTVATAIMAGSGVDPNRDNDDEGGGSMGKQAGFFDFEDDCDDVNLWDRLDDHF